MAIPNAVRASQSLAITPDDEDIISPVLEGIWVGTTGNISIQLEHDTSPQTWLNIPDGTFIQGRIARIFATNTTASNIIGVR